MAGDGCSRDLIGAGVETDGRSRVLVDGLDADDFPDEDNDAFLVNRLKFLSIDDIAVIKKFEEVPWSSFISGITKESVNIPNTSLATSLLPIVSKSVSPPSQLKSTPAST